MKKKTPVKIKYNRKSINKSEASLKEAINEFKAAAPKTELDEIEFLDAVVTGVEQMNAQQRSRFINYVYSRYHQYITLSKLSQ
jgi:hypothetical protein